MIVYNANNLNPTPDDILYSVSNQLTIIGPNGESIDYTSADSDSFSWEMAESESITTFVSHLAEVKEYSLPKMIEKSATTANFAFKNGGPSQRRRRNLAALTPEQMSAYSHDFYFVPSADKPTFDALSPNDDFILEGSSSSPATTFSDKLSVSDFLDNSPKLVVAPENDVSGVHYLYWIAKK